MTTRSAGSIERPGPPRFTTCPPEPMCECGEARRMWRMKKCLACLREEGLKCQFADPTIPDAEVNCAACGWK